MVLPCCLWGSDIYFLLQGYPCILRENHPALKVGWVVSCGHWGPWTSLVHKGRDCQSPPPYGPVEEHGRSCRRTNKRERERDVYTIFIYSTWYRYIYIHMKCSTIYTHKKQQLSLLRICSHIYSHISRNPLAIALFGLRWECWEGVLPAETGLCQRHRAHV